MKQDSLEIINGVKLHPIKTDKFKTDLAVISMSMPLSREYVTYDCLIPSVLKRGTINYHTQEEINRKLEEMYGTEFDCGIEKIGDNHVIKFYTESISDDFLPEHEELLLEQLKLLFEIAFKPYTENGIFKEEYLISEKENIRQKINSKIDNKEQYAVDRCTELMYKEEPYALYKYGYEEDLKNINNEALYKRYIEILRTSKIDIYISGNYDLDIIEKFIRNELQKIELNDRNPIYVQNNEQTEIKKIIDTQTFEEKLDIAQGKLILGLDIMENRENLQFAARLYNVILGESATSKLFQNVREKASLAYSARSTYVRQKNNIFIKCGIEIKNMEKALEIIMQQLEDMKQGKFIDEDINNAKKYMINGINSIEEEQDTEITYYIGQELSGINISLEKYLKEIQSVTREQIIDIANKIQINTIYFLRN